jgi:hypothetical protein
LLNPVAPPSFRPVHLKIVAAPSAYEQPTLNKAWEVFLAHIPTILIIWIVTAILNPGSARTFIGIMFAATIESAGGGVGMSPF